MVARSLYYLQKLTRNLRVKPSILREMQEKKLRTIVRYVYERVPFYHRKLDAAGIGPDDVRTIEDLSKIPLTTNKDMQAVSLAEITASNTDRGKCIRRMTSGSTGIPLEVLFDRRSIDLQNALEARTYFENGVKPWHKMIRFVEPGFETEIRWFQRLGLMRTKYLAIFEELTKQTSMIEKWKPDVIRGYSSVIEILAHFCKDNNRKINPKLVFTGAELLSRETRQIIDSAFQTELYDLYASVEFGLIAWECEAHSGYHINADNLIVEFVKNGSSVEQEERGKIVCTDLSNMVMPLIRYDTGDIGLPFMDRCSCGRTLPLMKVVEGRTGDHLITLDGKIIPPTFFFPYPFEKVQQIKQFRIIQEKRDLLIIQLVTEEGSSSGSLNLDKVRRNVKSVFGEDMQVEFEIVDKIERDPSGKLRKIISKVPVELT